MKKYLLFGFIFTFVLLAVFSIDNSKEIKNSEALTDNVKTLIETYKVEDTHSEHKTASVTIHYYPLTKQARIVYTDNFDVFDYDDAIVSLKRCLEDFTKKINCYHYTRYRDDEERNFKINNKKYTRVISYVIFSE